MLTFSGASGIVASDCLDRHGMTLARLSEETIKTLKEIFPEWMDPRNPVDLWPAIERVGREAYRFALKALLNDPGVDGIYLHLYADELLLKDLLDALAPLSQASKPVAIWLIGDIRCFPSLRKHLEPMGAPVFTEVGRGALVLSHVLESRYKIS